MTIAIAHRGDPLVERENTLALFALAVGHGADMIELDLRRTRDGAIVVLHDATLTRLWGVDASVADLDLAAVEAIGDGRQRIPTLRQVLDAVAIPLMVDFTTRTKSSTGPGGVREAGAVARSAIGAPTVSKSAVLIDVPRRVVAGVDLELDDGAGRERRGELVAHVVVEVVRHLAVRLRPTNGVFVYGYVPYSQENSEVSDSAVASLPLT